MIESLAAAAMLLLASSACGVADQPFSCTSEGAIATQSLVVELKALPSTLSADDQNCDSGDPRVVYFKSEDQSGLLDDLSNKRCVEVEVSPAEDGTGRAYECRFDAGHVDVWVERDPKNGSNTAYVSSPS